MDQQNQNPIQYKPAPAPASPVTPTMNTGSVGTPKQKKIGPIVAILVAVLVIVVVIVYLLASSSKVKTFGGAQGMCVAGATDCVDFIRILDDGSPTNTGPAVKAKMVPVNDPYPPAARGGGGIPVAPISNTADDLDSLQSDLDNSINGLNDQVI